MRAEAERPSGLLRHYSKEDILSANQRAINIAIFKLMLNLN